MADNLTELTLRTRYRSSEHNILRDFYLPTLKVAGLYQRAVGYFTSSSLAHAARGLTALIENGGRLELISSPMLTEHDIDQIRKGYRLRDEVVKEATEKLFSLDETGWVKRQLESLAWLISENRLDIKLSFKMNRFGQIHRGSGIYHEKIGVIHDRDGNFVAFEGSMNESEGGLLTNFERVPVHCSWDDPQERAMDISKDFNALWEDKTKQLKILPFTEVAAEFLMSYKPGRRPTIQQEIEAGSDTGLDGDILPGNEQLDFRLPSSIDLRDYQKKAIDNWVTSNGRGIFALATGTGKTITALAAATRLRTAGKLDSLLILCPYKHLVTQWKDELSRFGVDHPILAFENRQKWHGQLSGELATSRGSTDSLLCVICTNSTFGTDSFQDLLGSFPSHTLLIADEAHHLGAESLHEKLPESGFPMRLGLSATPERWQDDDGTDQLLNWFGPVVEPRITVADAIEMGFLCPYEYHPILINLTEAERERYLELSERINQLWARGHSLGGSPQMNPLLNERSRLISTAEEKIKALERLALKLQPLRRTLVYCGVGSTHLDLADDVEPVRHVEQVAKLLGKKLGVLVRRYTAETSTDDRERIKQELVEDDLQALVAINCLDEGVDIPCIETAIILSSSTNPRQFIQRRGRVLRRFAGKQYAKIYDMVVVPTDDEEPNDAERKLMEKELKRYFEFARAAINSAQAEDKILPIQKRYGLLYL